MIPAFCLIASGVRRILKAESLKSEKGTTVVLQNTLPQTQPINALPSTNTEYISPIGKDYTTDNLVVPSVTEETTKHLKIDN